MKIYRVDGSFIENAQDTDFGWTIEELIEDESRNFILLEEITPKINIEEAESVVDFQLNSEKSVSKIENIDSKIPSKTQVASLIDPCCVESKMLLSVVHHAKYKNLKRDVHNLGDLSGSSKLKFLINDREDDIENDIRHAINNYYENKEDKVLSLMMELILTDTKSELGDITDCPQNFDESGAEHSQDSTDESLPESKPDLSNRAEVLNSLEIGDIINRNLEKMCEESYDIHLKISELRKSFQDEETRVDTLIDNAQTLEKNLRETKFLEDLLHLLNGDLHKVKIKKSPFRIFLPSSNQVEPNLII